MQPVRVGVIGTGFGLRVVAPAFQRVGCEVVDVVAARDAPAVAALCRSNIDLVSVHAPPFLHAAYVRMAIEAGRAVHCDKPFGLDAIEAEALTAEATAAGVVHLTNFEFRHQPARRTMHELVSSGAIGHPEHLHYTAFTSGSRVPMRKHGWLFDRARGGGWIGAFGSHAIDMVRWLMGDVVDAGAAAWVRVPERPDAEGTPQHCDAEDAFVGWLRLASGATATIDTSFAAARTLAPRITLIGSEGAIENTADRQVVLRGADGTRQTFEFPPVPGDPHDAAMVGWASAVAEAVAGHQQITPSFEDGLACARVMDMMRARPPTVASVGTNHP